MCVCVCKLGPTFSGDQNMEMLKLLGVFCYVGFINRIVLLLVIGDRLALSLGPTRVDST
jgi:hypothetical protein